MKRQRLLNSSTAGFTLLEVLVVVIMIAVLAAIAAPGWLAFLNQQRVGKARNQLTQAIRDAQEQAKRTKVNRAVVFDNNSDSPRFAIVSIVPNSNNQCSLPASVTNWTNLGSGEIQQGNVRLTTKTETGTVQNALASRDVLIFDTYGNIAPCSTVQPFFTITVQSTSGINPRRCVRVASILGALQEDSDAACQS